MAEGTRMKSFEEQLRKQEARIQTILDSTATLEEKVGDTFQDMKALLEANRLEMKTFMTDMNNQFSTFVRGVNGDRGILGSPNHNQGLKPGG